jgi:hypothetical protein
MPLLGAHLRIGELLIDVGILNQDQISDAVTIAQKRGLPVGRALVMSGLLSEPMLQAALQVQSLFRDGLITREEGVNALQISSLLGVTLDEALDRLRWVQDKKVATNRLGELLVEADILPTDALDGYLLRSKESGLPLGRFLSSIGAVDEGLVMAVLNMQFLIRDGKINRESAIEALQAARERQLSVRRGGKLETASELPSSVSIRLGELLIKAGIMSNSELMCAVETALLNNVQLGEVLVQSDFITKGELETALLLQDMVANSTLKPSRAAQAMLLAHGTQISAAEALGQAGATAVESSEAIKLETFLGLAGLVSNREIKELGSPPYPTALRNQLVKAGKLSDLFFRDCQRIHALLVEGLLTLERAIVVLKHCQKSGNSAKATLQELGFKVPA